MASRKFQNNNTRFGSFTWGEDSRIRAALVEFKKKLGPGEPLPKRFKLKLGKETIADLKRK